MSIPHGFRRDDKQGQCCIVKLIYDQHVESKRVCVSGFEMTMLVMLVELQRKKKKKGWEGEYICLAFFVVFCDSESKAKTGSNHPLLNVTLEFG